MPKPLVPLLGQTLIERILRSCATAGVQQFLVVVGHAEETMRAQLGVLKERLGVSVTCVRAEDWVLGNGASMRSVAGHVGNRRFFLVMADHLFDPEILNKLLLDPPGSGEVCVAIDYDRQRVFDLDDATKVSCADGRLVAIAKNLDEWDGIDTGVFLCTPELFPALGRAQDAGQHSLSHGIAELVSRGLARAVDVTGCRWLDVDTPAALEEAERRLLASMHKDAQDGFVSRWINRPLSARLSKYLVRTQITPNQITVVSFLMFLMGSALLFFGTYAAGALGGVLLQAGSVVDGCDGEVARLKGIATPRGAWLDTMLDRYADLAVTFAIVAAYARHVPGAFPWVIGMIAATGFILVSYVTKEFKLRHQSDYPHDFLDRVKHRDLRVLVIAAGAMVGFAFEALLLVGVLSHAVVAGIMVRGWRGHSVHPTPPIRLAPAAIAPTTPTRRHLGGTRYLGEDAGVADTTG
jgi:CDP-L-myo-inositol myo-inositolphosphotransferase